MRKWVSILAIVGPMLAAASNGAIAQHKSATETPAGGDLGPLNVPESVALKCMRGETIAERIANCSQIVGNMDLPPEVRVIGHNNRGIAYFQDEKYDKALEDFTVAVTLKPEFAAAYNNRCYTLAHQGQPRQALPDCNKAIELRAGDPGIIDSRGYIYYLLGDYDSALKDYNQALRLDKDQAGTYLHRGMVYDRLGLKDQALADFRRARSLGRDNVEIQRTLQKFDMR